MSVPEGKRGEGKFEVLLKARDLTAYTIHICSNEKIFLPQYQTALTNDIIKESKDIFIKCFTANNIIVKEGDEDSKYKRKELQLQACMHCNNLLALIQIAQQVYHLKTSRIKYWGEKTIEVRNFIRKWIESDRKRYSA